LSISSQKYGFGIRDPRSGIRDPEKTYSGSRIQGSKRHRIPDPDPQHCQQVFISVKTAIEERVLDLTLSSKEKPVTLPKVSFFRSGILRIRNYFLRIRNYLLRIRNYLLRIQKYLLRIRNYLLGIRIYLLRIRNYLLRIRNYLLRIRNDLFRTQIQIFLRSIIRKPRTNLTIFTCTLPKSNYYSSKTTVLYALEIL
jgi:hypothetical protein